jgi:hypothetical protein
VDIPDLPDSCQQLGVNNCLFAATLFADQGIQAGGTNMGLSQIEIDQLKAISLVPTTEPQVLDDYTGLKNWRCASPGGADPPVCMYIARGKRLNQYPNSLELILFDGKDLDNPSYALWVAAHASGAPGVPPPGIEEVCPIWLDIAFPTPAPHKRYPFATFTLGGTTESW